MIFVIAGDFKQYELWCRINGFSPKDRLRTIYIQQDSPQLIRGYYPDVHHEYIKVGTWYKRKDIDSVLEELEYLRAKEVTRENI
jgi:hypothetical protein